MEPLCRLRSAHLVSSCPRATCEREPIEARAATLGRLGGAPWPSINVHTVTLTLTVAVTAALPGGHAAMRPYYHAAMLPCCHGHASTSAASHCAVAICHVRTM
jgi:hypothetical protein